MKDLILIIIFLAVSFGIKKLKESYDAQKNEESHKRGASPFRPSSSPRDDKRSQGGVFQDVPNPQYKRPRQASQEPRTIAGIPVFIEELEPEEIFYEEAPRTVIPARVSTLVTPLAKPSPSKAKTAYDTVRLEENMAILYDEKEMLSGDLCSPCYTAHQEDNRFSQLLQNRPMLADSIVLREILDKPLALRGSDGGIF